MTLEIIDDLGELIVIYDLGKVSGLIKIEFVSMETGERDIRFIAKEQAQQILDFLTKQLKDE